FVWKEQMLQEDVKALNRDLNRKAKSAIRSASDMLSALSSGQVFPLPADEKLLKAILADGQTVLIIPQSPLFHNAIASRFADALGQRRIKDGQVSPVDYVE